MTPLIHIPKTFFDDHSDRELPTPEVVRIERRHYVVRADDPAVPELLNDAAYYADRWGPDAISFGLKASARATMLAIRRSISDRRTA